MKKAILLSLIFTFFHSVEAQLFDESFLSSLPDNIKADFQNQASLEPKEDDPLPTPETRIKNLESALQEAKSTLKNIERDLQQGSASGSSDLVRFGDAFFRTYQSTFSPINIPNVQSNYIIDVGDMVSLQLVGQRNEIFKKLLVKRNGAINVKEVGDISIAGLSIIEASDLIKKLTSQIFIGTEAYLTVTELRDMNVMIVGNVTNPGMYTLSGGSSALALINAAGGINKNGSYRSIEHKRNGELINTVDLYDVFISGDLSKISQLRSGDSIIIKQSFREVQISGGVTNPAIYELKDNENLSDLLEFAGLKSRTNSLNTIVIERVLSGDYQNFEVMLSDATKTDLKHGDSVEIPFINPSFNQTKKITITGEVKIPGTYYVKDNTMLSDLLTMAGNFTDNAYPLGGVLMRESVKDYENLFKEKSYNELIRFIMASGSGTPVSLSSDSLLTFLSLLKDYQPTGRLVSEFELSELKKDPLKDRRLESGDSIHIPAFMNQVYVFGEVLNPTSYNFDPKLSVSDYLELSGGFSRSADETKVILIHPNGTAKTIQFGFFSGLLSEEQILPGSLVYVPQYIGKVDGISLAAAVAPILSSFALSVAPLNSINN